MAKLTSPRFNVVTGILKKTTAIMRRCYGEAEMQQGNLSGIKKAYDEAFGKTSKMAFDELSDIYKEESILVEGHPKVEKSTDNVWLVNAIDNAENFSLAKSPVYSLFTYLENGEVVETVLYDAIADEKIVASKAHGAFYDQGRLRVSGTKSLSGAKVAICLGDIKSKTGAKDAVKAATLVPELVKLGANVVISGYGLGDVVNLGKGQVDAAVVLGLNTKSAASAYLIAKESGASVLNLDGSEASKDSLNIVAGNDKVCEKLVKLLS